MRYLTAESVQGWEELCRNVPGATRTAWETITANPTDRSSPHRQAQLKGKKLSHHQVESVALEQWQYEVTGAGRIWYCPDPDKKIVWLTFAGTGHPKATD